MALALYVPYDLDLVDPLLQCAEQTYGLLALKALKE
jgi:hypothetical protein